MPETVYADALVETLQEKAEDFAKAGDSAAVKKVIVDAQKEAAEKTPRPLEFDKWVYRTTVGVLGVAVLFVAYAQYDITIARLSDKIPDGLIAIGSAAIGALAGLLAPTPSR